MKKLEVKHEILFATPSTGPKMLNRYAKDV